MTEEPLAWLGWSSGLSRRDRHRLERTGRPLWSGLLRCLLLLPRRRLLAGGLGSSCQKSNRGEENGTDPDSAQAATPVINHLN